MPLWLRPRLGEIFFQLPLTNRRAVEYIQMATEVVHCCAHGCGARFPTQVAEPTRGGPQLGHDRGSRFCVLSCGLRLLGSWCRDAGNGHDAWRAMPTHMGVLGVTSSITTIACVNHRMHARRNTHNIIFVTDE